MHRSLDNSLSAPADFEADLIIVGGTPAGIGAAIAAARQGRSAIILERTSHVGGLPANGLGATDISTRGAAGGFFKDFVDRVRSHYVTKYGEDSEQVRICSDGFHFEPSVGELVLLEMLAEHPSVTVKLGRQFDALSERVRKSEGRISGITVRNLQTGADETYQGSFFIDATYEGDLAAASGVPFSTRREGHQDYFEPMAGRVYQKWGFKEIGEGSTYLGDDTIQAYNFRLCLTSNPRNRVQIEKPEGYDRSEYASLVEDLVHDRMPGVHHREREWDGIGRITNIVWLPNDKTDANNQHLAFLSTDLPEENYLWPTADWAWRDAFAIRLRNYILGLFWFMQNDPEVPESFRLNAARFGLAADEYQDNGHFPRQVYVREGRRIAGEFMFLAQDAIPVAPGLRPPIHPTSITASHYPVDSHAVRKREPGRDHLDGFLSVDTRPYTVPYGIMVPRFVENLLVPVAVSASHLGFGTLRMEPCWMALGEASGVAAALALDLAVPSRSVPIGMLQRELIVAGAILIFYRDVDRHDPAHAGLQYLGVRAAIPEWEAELDRTVSETEWECWHSLVGLAAAPLEAGLTRRDALIRLWALINGTHQVSRELFACA